MWRTKYLVIGCPRVGVAAQSLPFSLPRLSNWVARECPPCPKRAILIHARSLVDAAVANATGWRLSDASYLGRAGHSGLRNPDFGFLVKPHDYWSARLDTW